MKNNDCKELMYYLMEMGIVRLVTNLGDIVLEPKTASNQNRKNEYESSFAKVTSTMFDKGGDTVYRSIKLICKKELILYRIDFVTDFNRCPNEFVEYKSFLNAPAAAFVRYDTYGFYTGVENPFFSASSAGSEVILSYEPSLILKEGEVYESEPQFLGNYVRSGMYVKEKEPINIGALERGIKRPRFFNPCGEIPLDLAEIDAMRSYVEEYYDVIKRQFDNILYFFFYPKKQFPKTEEEVQDYLQTIDRFSDMQGDIIAFNPHVNTIIPTREQPFWELAPQNSSAERILRHAQDKGLRCGYYMGCAFNGDGGNAALLPFMPEEKAWKKVDEFGNVASENCLGCDDYLEWWYEVQRNTIAKYNLGYWSWDPGPGNGNDCYATNHGHIPGKGEYKGWRNSQKLLARIKETFPELFLMSFYGRKEYGIWGFRYFSQHEVYWEQTVLFGATLHNDLHDDRINAHGTRLQNQWCMNFRFLPAHLGHGLVPRMGESWFDPEMDRAYDFGGFRYALLSAIACCGSVTHCTIPDCLENVPGYLEFYKKWIAWAKENYHYCNFTRPIGDCVSNDIIDGFARIDRDNGQIFLFNSSPKIMNKKLTLDERLGLDTIDSFYLGILYCEGMNLEQKALQYNGKYHMDDVLDITLPPYGMVILELQHTKTDSISEIPMKIHTIDKFTDVSGDLFEYPYHEAYDEVSLVAHATFHSELKNVLSDMHIENEEYLKEKIKQWNDGGMPFTFASALPSRLVMYIPFDGPQLPNAVCLYINDKEVPVQVFRLRETPVFHYAYVEDYVDWGHDNTISLKIRGLAKNSFMGIHVDYPDICNGMESEVTVFSERLVPSELYYDASLVIDSFVLNPDVLSDKGGKVSVTVKTKVVPELIEGVYYLHPACSEMIGLEYNPDTDLWVGKSEYGVRSHNIFCNTKIMAWIKAKDGGVGPRKECDVRMRYESV